MFERLLKIFLPVAFGVALQTLSANALGGSIVIAQVQAGSASGDGAATQEFISIYNNTGAPIDVTNWCFSNKTSVKFACITAPDINTTLSLPAHSYALIASSSFASRFGGEYDSVFTVTNNSSGSLVGGNDTITLLNSDGASVDSIGWTSSLAGGTTLTRLWADQSAGVLLDTDLSTDFKKVSPLAIPVGGVVEETHITDVCVNLEGVQQTLPAGYWLVGSDCIQDVCPNLTDLQVDVPQYMRVNEQGKCVYSLPNLIVTEMLPNATGTDDGNEFIEIYNPGNETVDLALYRLQVGPNFDKTYGFAPGASIEPQSYKSFFNDSVTFSLLNTSSRVRLISVDGQVVSESLSYVSPADNEAWALLSGSWMYTNQPTPGAENLLPIDEGVVSDGVVTQGLKPCAANQYRNPDTNRCRIITTDTGDAKPCKDGQYRSEETNRCRSIATDVSAAKPCADDQYRNPDTGRCRKIANDDEVKDCGEGRERNPTTNRCRNIVTTASGRTSGGVTVVPATAASVFGWWAAAIVCFIAIGYAALEWRREIGRWIGRHFGWLARPLNPLRIRLQRLRYNRINENHRH